jgi:hypothetical protein
LLIYSIGLQAIAAPQHMGFGGKRKIENRAQVVEQRRNARMAEKAAEGQKERDTEPPGGAPGSTQQAGANIQAERPAARFNRLSPEERKALRRQIQEAGSDIYTQKK